MLAQILCTFPNTMWFTFILCRSLPEPLDQKETIEVVSDLESSEDEHEELTKVVVDEGVANKWDCESILSECDRVITKYSRL